MPKVSIIIPVYNMEQYLIKCLDSVINQTLQDIEIICINDGSTDHSLEILKEYASKDNRIIIIDKENGGLSSARNAGIKKSTGEYIGFVDSDDWISLDYFELLYNTATKHNADIACCSISKVIEGNPRKYFEIKNEKVYKETKDKYKAADIPQKCYVVNRIYKREKVLMTEVLFELGILFEDMEWTHKILYYLGKMVTVPNCRYFYRIREDSIVGWKSEKHIQSLNTARYKCLMFIQNNFIELKNLESYYCDKQITFNFLGIPICKIKYYGGQTNIYLFGLPIIKIDVYGKTL